MGLPFPFPVVGYTYDSNREILVSTQVYFSSGLNSLNVVSNSGGKYVANIQDYAYSGCTMTITALGLGEKVRKQFKVILSGIHSLENIYLTESNRSGVVYLNTYRGYGNNLYIFGSTNNVSWLKTVDG